MKKFRKYIIIAIVVILAFILFRSLFTSGSNQQSAAQETTASFEIVTEAAQKQTGETPAAQTVSPTVNAESEAVYAAETAGELVSDPTIGAVSTAESEASSSEQTAIDEDGEYSSKDEVALYIHTYGKLPKNYITKTKAKKLGWEQYEGNLDEVLPGMSIGGSPFGNNEGLLPEAKGRKYYECDIDYKGGSRNAKRIIYSNDGLIFYTDDHYNSFEQLY